MKKSFATLTACIMTAYFSTSNLISATGTINPAQDNSQSILNTVERMQSATGDVNADGQFSIADIVLMQQWLLDSSTANLANGQAGDFCADGKLDAFDLSSMKRALMISSVQNPLEQLIGMRYEDAVANGYISKSEYNYQITGNLKQTIEEKMGRPLDYSIDRFYLVNREQLGLENNTINYLYNSSTMDVYVICEETKMNCATWYWKGTKAALYGIDDDMETQNAFLDAIPAGPINWLITKMW